MSLFRTQFNDDIVAEFLPASRPSSQVMILCDGLPSLPYKKHVLEYWSKRGFWVFHMRYRGTWESGGQFLEREPQEDVLALIGALQYPFVDVWSGVEFSLQVQKIVVMGASFGGTTALMASLDDRVDQVIALAPVVDWSIESEREPHDTLFQIIQQGYGGAYRCRDDNDWGQLKNGTFFNPLSHEKKFDGKKILIMHAQDDDIVYHDPTAQFAQKIGATFHSLPHGGHLSTRMTTKWRWGRRINKFLM